jgi:hypothetical protein
MHPNGDPRTGENTLEPNDAHLNQGYAMSLHVA